MYSPEKVLRDESLSTYYCMGLKMALYFALGWFFLFPGQYIRWKAGRAERISRT